MLSHAVGIVKGPHSKLIQHSELGEDVEVSKVVGFLFCAVGMRLAFRLVFILRAYRLIPVVEAGCGLARCMRPTMDRNLREIATRRDELQQLKAHLF